MNFVSTLKNSIRALFPAPVFKALIRAYHFLFGWGAALFYGFPARKLFVIGITGTKGKSSTAEMVNAILEEAGYRTALLSTIRFKVGKESRPNLFKMTMQGRGFLQKTLSEAVKAGCTHAVLELTSEGALQFRDAGVAMNALIFTNIQPEHIEAHGSYEKYKDAKMGIARALVRSPKRPRIIVANPTDEVGARMLALSVDVKRSFTLEDARPYALQSDKASLTYKGVTFEIAFPGEFSILNALAGATVADELGVDAKTIALGLSKLKTISGRVERIDEGQDFKVIVDYAHTPDSLRALYAAYPEKRKICVLGNTGGGRDTWKRPEMGKIADDTCAEVILTNEDPYDEDPEKIVQEMATGMKRKPKIIMDRREAIRTALGMARAGDAVLISGKGTDPYIMEAGGKKTPWSDSAVAREEIKKLVQKQ
ncbi:UDP-N-acetylmuramoyl-L-alanyl-D-glutamate--2,6-diaminopimelate ligase [Patescibacteria group bacterium]|nr:UDP-N-acetylmuramoyl-L-alanyl-D-glutamate--2,6-diaminopimelate ligase [Patescibacteria group bacterium]